MQVIANSYFSGAGLFDIGLRDAGIKINQSFEINPDDFVFTGTDNQNYIMIGNGAPVPIGRWVGGELKRYFRRR